jgi:hypothetical protein
MAEAKIFRFSQMRGEVRKEINNSIFEEKEKFMRNMASKREVIRICYLPSPVKTLFIEFQTPV